ncbi:MAG: ATP-binding protein [Actinomycetota bacterium]|nr:ATP-binding protein [Actinomycetota bacterium]
MSRDDGPELDDRAASPYAIVGPGWRRLVPRTLRARLTSVVVIGASLLLIAGLGVLYVVLERQLHAAIDDGLRARVDDVSAAATTGEGGQLADPYAQVLRSDGTVVAASSSAPGRAVLTAEQRRVARDELIFVSTSVPGLESPARLAAQSVPGTDRIVVVGTSLDDVEETGDRLLLVLGLALPVLLILLALVLRWTIRASLRPVSALTTRAGRISTAGSTERLPEPQGQDEIAELARTLNAMLDRIGIAFERERAFVDDASHELRTPIAVLRGELELALLDNDPGQMRRAVEIAQAEAEHLSNLAVDLLVLARQRAGSLVLERGRVEVREAVERTVGRLRRLSDASLTVTGAAVTARLDAARLDQLIVNLVTNAVQAGAGRVRVTVARSDADVEIQVDDDGPGFPEELLTTAFDRFTRGDAARTRRQSGKAPSGAGLGLPIAAAIVRAHGGEISVGNDSELGGARVRIRLPLEVTD